MLDSRPIGARGSGSGGPETGVVNKRSVVIVGGGYSGASFALQVSRATRVPLAISIVEPRAALGRGLAYSTEDPDHRLNGPLDNHTLDPGRPEEVRQWAMAAGVLAGDPDATCPSGAVFLRRRDFGRYLSDALAVHARDAGTGSRIDHVRDTAVAVRRRGGAFEVQLSAGDMIHAEMLVVTTGNGAPALRAPFRPEDAAHPRIVADPLQADWRDKATGARRILVVGGGLTALDIVSSLLRTGDAREITVISRRGLRPAGHAPIVVGPDRIDPANAPQVDLSIPIPDFMLYAPPTARGWLKAMREAVRDATRDGGTWHDPFDRVRDCVARLWPRLTDDEKRRFLRRLRVYYDVHRFRAPPTNDTLVRQAEAAGRVRFLAASLARVSAMPGDRDVTVELRRTGRRDIVPTRYDLVVNCTGLESAGAWKASPFLASLVSQGALTPHPTGLGFDVDDQCRALDPAGTPQPMLRVVGPPTAGVFGDPLGAVFIAAQIQRILPNVTASLAGVEPPWAAFAKPSA